MELKTIAIVFITSLAQAKASAVVRNETEWFVIHERPIENGKLSYLGIPSIVPADWDWNSGWDTSEKWVAPQAINRRCGSNQIHCDGSNQAPSSVCQTLVNILIKDPSAGVPSGITALTYSSGSFTCVVAWRGVISNMLQGYLSNAASLTLGNCGASGAVSGYATDVSLNNACATQCLSNRAAC